MHYWPSLPQLVGRHVNIITNIISHLCLHHPVHGSIVSWSLSLCFFYSLLISTSLVLFLWIEDSFSSLHLQFSIFLSLSIPSFIPQNKWCTLSPALLLAITQSLSLQKVNPHWAHQPRVYSLHPLTDESERVVGRGGVAKLTASSEPKHIKGSASN